MRSRVGFIGAGQMGRPMVRRLLEAGHRVRVLARSDASRSGLVEYGIAGDHLVTSIAEATADAEFVIVCLYSDEQVHDVGIRDHLLEGMRPGATVIVHTTCDPATVEILGGAGEKHGIAVVDAPVSGGPNDIEQGVLTTFLGGSDEAVSRVRPLLHSYASVTPHVGAIGAGQRVKLVNNALFGATIGLVCDAVRLGESIGVPESVLLEALPVGSADSRAVRLAGALGSVQDLSDKAGRFIAKDRMVVEQVAQRLGGDLGILVRAAGRFDVR